MSRKSLFYVIVALIGVLLLSSASAANAAPANNSPEKKSVAIAYGVAAEFGDRNPRLISSTVISRTEYKKETQSRGDEIPETSIFGTGDMLVVKFSGNFSPRRGPANIVHPTFHNLHVEIDLATMIVISVGCDNNDDALSTTLP